MGFLRRDVVVDHHAADPRHQVFADSQPAPVGELFLERHVAVAMPPEPRREPVIGARPVAADRLLGHPPRQFLE